MAMAVRAKDAGLVVGVVDKALAELADAGEIRKLYAAQGVAYTDRRSRARASKTDHLQHFEAHSRAA